MEILDNIVRVLMYISLGLNIWGFILSMRVVKRARKIWERANELADALSELHDEYVTRQATEAFINTMDGGEQQ
jgi:hypothetical protein